MPKQEPSGEVPANVTASGQQIQVGTRNNQFNFVQAPPTTQAPPDPAVLAALKPSAAVTWLRRLDHHQLVYFFARAQPGDVKAIIVAFLAVDENKVVAALEDFNDPRAAELIWAVRAEAPAELPPRVLEIARKAAGLKSTDVGFADAAELDAMSAGMAAAALTRMTAEAAGSFLSAMSPERASLILGIMEPERGGRLLQVMVPVAVEKVLDWSEDRQAGEFLASMTSERGARVLEAMDQARVARILPVMAPEKSGMLLGWLSPLKAAQLLAAMPSGGAGRLLDVLAPESARTVLGRLPRDGALVILSAMASQRAARVLEVMEPAGAAGFLGSMKQPAGGRVTQSLSRGKATQLLSLMPNPTAARILHSVSRSHLAALLQSLDSPKASQLIALLSPEVAARAFELIAPAQAVRALRASGTEVAKRTLELMAPEAAWAVIASQRDDQTGTALELMTPATAARVAEKGDSERVTRILEAMKPRTAARIIARATTSWTARTLAAMAPEKAETVIESLSGAAAATLITAMIVEQPKQAAVALEAVRPALIAEILENPRFTTSYQRRRHLAARSPASVFLAQAARLLLSMTELRAFSVLDAARTGSFVGKVSRASPDGESLVRAYYRQRRRTLIMAACNEIASFMLVCVPLPALVALILGPLYSVGSPWWLLLLLPATLAMFINLRPIWSGKIFTAAAPAIWCCAFCLVCGLLTAGAIAHALTPGVAICGVTFSIYFIVRFLKEELSHRR